MQEEARITRELVKTVKISRYILLILILIITCGISSGCWNYKEVEQLAIAVGAAVDMNEDGSVKLTIEIVNIGGDGSVTYEPVYIESTGDTIFEATRKAVTFQGKKIYWSHVKVVILSQEIVKQDTTKHLDFLFRDAEAREDLWLLVSAAKTAAEVLRSKGMLRPLVSFELDDTMRSQKVLSRFPSIALFEFFDRFFYGDVAPVLPLAHVVDQSGVKTTQIEGTAIIKNNKLVGTLNVEETRWMLLLRDEVKGGIFVIKDPLNANEDVAFEIFKNKTKIKPELKDGVLRMKADVKLTVNIAEAEGSSDIFKGAGLQKLKKNTEEQLEKKTMEMYTNVRDTYDADVFGFGRQINIQMPEVWNQIKDNWDEYFAEMELDINVNLNIRGSATTKTPLKEGE
jgi:spore germination protein KC